ETLVIYSRRQGQREYPTASCLTRMSPLQQRLFSLSSDSPASPRQLVRSYFSHSSQSLDGSTLASVFQTVSCKLPLGERLGGATARYCVLDLALQIQRLGRAFLFGNLASRPHRTRQRQSSQEFTTFHCSAIVARFRYTADLE